MSFIRLREVGRSGPIPDSSTTTKSTKADTLPPGSSLSSLSQSSEPDFGRCAPRVRLIVTPHGERLTRSLEWLSTPAEIDRDFFAPPPRVAGGRGVSGGLNETIASPLLGGGDRPVGPGFNSGRERGRKAFAGLGRPKGCRASTRAIGRKPSRCALDAKGYAFDPARRLDRCGAGAGISELVQPRSVCSSAGNLGDDYEFRVSWPGVIRRFEK